MATPVRCSKGLAGAITADPLARPMTSPGRYRSNYPRSAFDAPDLLHYTVLAGREPNLQTYRPRSDRRLLLQPTTAHTTVADMAAAA